MIECPVCGNPVYGSLTDGGDSGFKPIMIRYRCSRCGAEAREPEPYEAREPYIGEEEEGQGEEVDL